MKNKILITFVTLLFTISLLNAQNISWLKTVGGKIFDEGTNVVVDNSTGLIYVVGNFRGVVDFDPGAGVSNLTSAGETDIFIQKLDADGNLLWVKRIGGAGYDRVTDIKVDGGIFVVGVYERTVDFNPGTPVNNLTAAAEGSFYLKMTATGEFISVQNVGVGAGNINATAMDIANGSSYIVGIFEGTFDFDPSAGVNNITSKGSIDIFIQKLDATGKVAWVKTFGSTGDDWPNDVLIPKQGAFDVFLTGSFEGTVDFNPGTTVNNFASVGGTDIFVLALDKGTGDYTWAKSMGSGLNDIANAMAFSLSAGLYVTGFFKGTVDFNSEAPVNNLTAIGDRDAFLLNLRDNGAFESVVPVGRGTAVTSYSTGNSIALDFNGNIYVAGHFEGTVDFDPSSGTSSVTSKGGTDAFVSQVARNDKALVWVKTYGGTEDDQANAISMNENSFPEKTPYITGSFRGTVNFDPNSATFNKTSNGWTDVFVVKLTRDGVGLVENTFASDVKLYPNPTSNNVTIELGNNYTNVAVEITNILGQVITSKSIATVTNRKIILPIEASSGIYFVKVEAKEGFASFKVIKE